MSQTPPSPTSPMFVRISDRDLTEIELHSVESISDLHRTHPEHNHKGISRSPRSQIPSPNGNVCLPDSLSVCSTGAPQRRRWRARLADMLVPSRFCCGVGGALILLLLSLFLILYFLVQQGGALQSLTEAIRERQAAAVEISQLFQEIQALRHNLTAMAAMRP